MKLVTIEEAIKLANSDQSLEGIVIKDLNDKQVKVQDALALSRAGIVLPEQNVYYDDSDLEYDEDIDELVFTSGVVNLSWEEKIAKFASESNSNKETKIVIELSMKSEEINLWLNDNKSRVAELLRPIVIGIFHAENSMKH